MIFLAPQPSEAELREIYLSDYYRSWGGDSQESARAVKLRTFDRQLRLFSKRLRPGRILDVGCATGFLLEAAESLGWEGYGVEFSEYAADVARQHFGDRIFNGTVEEARYPSAHFDLITLSDVLEHIPQPRSFLREISRILAPRGKLMIVTPDVASLSAKMMGHRWNHYHREHLHYFTPGTLDRLLTECGFAVKHVQGASKYLSLSYLAGQLRAHPHPVLTPLANLAEALLPPQLKNAGFSAPCGQMLVLAEHQSSATRKTS